MSNKYSHSDHIAILSELITLQTVMNETQVKINVLKKQLAKIDKQKKDEDEIPF